MDPKQEAAGFDTSFGRPEAQKHHSRLFLPGEFGLGRT